MSVFAISDLHLPLGIDKPMNVFGPRWENYVDRLRDNWQKIVGENDVVIMPGDISWATYLEDSLRDFEYLNALSGIKIILKGNHDYWWTTMNKLKVFAEKNGFDSIKFVHNNCYMHESGGKKLAVCGTRGWNIAKENSTDEDKRLFLREKERMILSLESAASAKPDEIIAAMHYPPIEKNGLNRDFIQIFKEYGVKICVYGHLHAAAQDFAVQGDIDGVKLVLVASDYLKFVPKLIRG